MKNILNLVKKAFLIIGLGSIVITIISNFITGPDFSDLQLKQINGAYVTSIKVSMIFVIIAFGFSYSKSKALNSTSNLLFVIYTISCIDIVIWINRDFDLATADVINSNISHGLGYYLLIISIISIIIYLVLHLGSYLYNLFDEKVNDYKSYNTSKLFELKELFDNGIIDEKEFKNEKEKILGKSTKKLIPSYSKLRELNVLRQDSIITESEYTSLKSDLLNK